LRTSYRQAKKANVKPNRTTFVRPAVAATNYSRHPPFSTSDAKAGSNDLLNLTPDGDLILPLLKSDQNHRREKFTNLSRGFRTTPQAAQ